ncbi:DUF4230 domain-containing protein [Salinispira pacifica]|uniref:DUF4230 domain-containing protein n=1 Tax=Salinispira pacifica TaxID=1307761 RepID=V5WLV8_9SPIO|nr:DUF4230 domain-containing protein [Salinispira pacifica]AHC16590.1 hypothetical protein L21SP2_3250 [Salinispira pacifica]
MKNGKSGPVRRILAGLAGKIIFWLLLFALVTGGAAALFTPVFVGPYIDLSALSPLQRRRTTGHQGVLEQMRELSRVQTVEYIYKTVFPQDYFSEDISLNGIFDTLRDSTVPGSGETDYRSVLSPRQLLYFDAYTIARDAGLDPLGGRRDFLVITAILEIGIDFSEQEPQIRLIPGDTEEEADSWSITLPDPRILNIRIEDSTSSNYPYPDISLDQENWKAIAGFVQANIADMPRIDELRSRSKESLQGIFGNFLAEGVNIQIKFDSIGPEGQN